MCVAMVIIFKKTLEKKHIEDVTSKHLDIGQLRQQTMSQGTALFSCGLMETSRWYELGRGCSMPQKPRGTSLESLWTVVPEAHRTPAGWRAVDAGETGTTPGTITGLLQELSLADAAGAASSFSTAPPSKRQCRSLSCSDELAGGCRTSWRPQGSRVWTAVEKRRCHSGGSVQRGAQGGALPAMQRSSSFSLPARSNAALLEPGPCFARRPAAPAAFTGLAPSSSSVTLSPAPPLYLSQEQICLPEPQGPSPASSPDSTPELERRGVGQGGLARSRSQPCVLNDNKIGVKRRRPADSYKQRPSLDLAKMTQKLRNFHSLSCPGITGDDGSQSSQAPPSLGSAATCESDFPCLSEQGAEEPPTRTKEGEVRRSGGADPTIEELGWNSPDCGDMTAGTTNVKDREHLWVGLCSPRKDMYQLGGELDIDQIERN